MRETLAPDYFARLYERDADPWRFATSSYERAKYRATLDALEGARFARAFEIGCSIGVLSKKLAAICDALVAIDVDPRALAAARKRNARSAHTRFEQMTFPHDVPAGSFDLVVVSEVAYYWSDRDFAAARDRIVALAPGGTLVLVHFTPVVHDYVRTGDAVHDAFLADERFAWLRGSRAPRYRLDLMRVQ